MTKTNRILLFVGVAVYAVLFILIALYVFIENDESQPLNVIFQWGYLIPVSFYSLFSLWVSFGVFLFLNKLFNYLFSMKTFIKIVSFVLSLIIGIPVGVVALDKMLRLFTA